MLLDNSEILIYDGVEYKVVTAKYLYEMLSNNQTPLLRTMNKNGEFKNQTIKTFIKQDFKQPDINPLKYLKLGSCINLSISPDCMVFKYNGVDDFTPIKISDIDYGKDKVVLQTTIGNTVDGVIQSDLKIGYAKVTSNSLTDMPLATRDYSVYNFMVDDNNYYIGSQLVWIRQQ